jgi:hypothetical protein
MCCAAQARHAVRLQARLAVTQALVHNRLTVDQGTTANEALHHTLWRLIKNHGGSRNFKTLYLMLQVAIFVYNGAMFCWCCYLLEDTGSATKPIHRYAEICPHAGNIDGCVCACVRPVVHKSVRFARAISHARCTFQTMFWGAFKSVPLCETAQSCYCQLRLPHATWKNPKKVAPRALV